MKRLCGLIIVAAFVAVGCNRAEQPAAFTPTPHGNLAQVMQAIPFTASNIAFDAQNADPGVKPDPADPTASAGATSLYSSVYGGWTAVENAGVALQETVNLIMIPGRVCSNGKPVPLEDDLYKKAAANLASIGAEVQKYGQAKAWTQESIDELTGKVSDACTMCHEAYRDTPKQPEDRCTPGGVAPAAQ